MDNFTYGVLVGLGIAAFIVAYVEHKFPSKSGPLQTYEDTLSIEEQQPQMPQPTKSRTMWDLPDPYVPDTKNKDV